MVNFGDGAKIVLKYGQWERVMENPAKASKRQAEREILCRKSSELIELARKTFSLESKDNRELQDIPHEITLENFPRVIDNCPMIKKVYAFRIKLHAMEKIAPLSDGQKLELLIDSARGVSQLAKILLSHGHLLDKIKVQNNELTEEEEDVLDDLTIALSKIFLSRSVTIKRKRSTGKSGSGRKPG